MTPEEHYAKAEHWLALATTLHEDDSASARALELFQQRAQIHATLATCHPNLQEKP